METSRTESGSGEPEESKSNVKSWLSMPHVRFTERAFTFREKANRYDKEIERSAMGILCE